MCTPGNYKSFWKHEVRYLSLESRQSTHPREKGTNLFLVPHTIRQKERFFVVKICEKKKGQIAFFIKLFYINLLLNDLLTQCEAKKACGWLKVCHLHLYKIQLSEQGNRLQ